MNVASIFQICTFILPFLIKGALSPISQAQGKFDQAYRRIVWCRASRQEIKQILTIDPNIDIFHVDNSILDHAAGADDNELALLTLQHPQFRETMYDTITGQPIDILSDALLRCVYFGSLKVARTLLDNSSVQATPDHVIYPLRLASTMRKAVTERAPEVSKLIFESRIFDGSALKEGLAKAISLGFPDLAEMFLKDPTIPVNGFDQRMARLTARGPPVDGQRGGKRGTTYALLAPFTTAILEAFSEGDLATAQQVNLGALNARQRDILLSRACNHSQIVRLFIPFAHISLALSQDDHFAIALGIPMPKSALALSQDNDFAIALGISKPKSVAQINAFAQIYRVFCRAEEFELPGEIIGTIGKFM